MTDKTREAFEAFLATPAPDEYDASNADAWHIWQAATASERKPLSDAEIDAVTDAQWGKGCEPNQYLAHRAYARAIEAAIMQGGNHG